MFHSIKPLFAGKPLLLVLTKCDLIKYEQLSEENKKLLQSILDNGIEMISMSNMTEEGITDVKQSACDMLLEHRVETKLAKGGKKIENILNRIHLAQPMKRDEKKRETAIPESVLAPKDLSMDVEKKTEKDLEDENGGAGIYSPDLNKHYILKDASWKYDIIPEIMNGKNIADFIDTSILSKLEALEKEEAMLLANGDDDINYAEDDMYVTAEDEAMFNKIEGKKYLYKQKHAINHRDVKKLPRKYKTIDLDKVAAELLDRGVDQEVIERARSRSQSAHKSKSLSKSRARSLSEQRVLEEYESMPESGVLGKRKRTLTPSNRARSASNKYAGISDPTSQVKAIQLGNKKRKVWTQDSRKGEADRHVFDIKPKHLFSGKRSNGALDRR